MSLVLDAHGGLDRWRTFRRLAAHLAAGGPTFRRKGWPDLFTNVTLTLDTRREHVTITPFLAPDRTSVFDVGPERFRIEAAGGATVDQRDDPRSSFGGDQASTTPWDAIQIGYFVSYAMWNYLTTPLLFTYAGVESREIEPWHEDGQTWRRLAVTFPSSIATHNPDQVFYFDADYLQRRVDYAPVVAGNVMNAHYTDEHRTFDGIVFPTRRRAYRRDAHGIADKSLAVIALDIDNVGLR